MSDEEELLALEERGWAALSTPDGAAFYEGVMTADCAMLFPGMGVLDREEALAEMRRAVPWSSFEIEGARVVRPAPDVAVVAYHVEAERPGQPEYGAYLASTYVRVAGTWRLAFHQHSPDPVG